MYVFTIYVLWRPTGPMWLVSQIICFTLIRIGLEGSCFKRGALRNFIQSVLDQHSLSGVALCIIGVAVIVDLYVLH